MCVSAAVCVYVCVSVVIIGMSSEAVFAFDRLPASPSAAVPQPSTFPEDHGKQQWLCSRKSLTASHSRSNNETGGFVTEA